DREAILANRFRGGEPGYRLVGAAGGIAAAATLDLRGDARSDTHRALNGPYPPDSWASCPPPQVPAKLFAPDKAREFARAAAKGKGKPPPVELTLKSPTGDIRVERACQDIAAQLGELGTSVGRPVRVRSVGLPPQQLREDLEQRNYEL